MLWKTPWFETHLFSFLLKSVLIHIEQHSLISLYTMHPFSPCSLQFSTWRKYANTQKCHNNHRSHCAFILVCKDSALGGTTCCSKAQTSLVLFMKAFCCSSGETEGFTKFSAKEEDSWSCWMEHHSLCYIVVERVNNYNTFFHP